MNAFRNTVLAVVLALGLNGGVKSDYRNDLLDYGYIEKYQTEWVKDYERRRRSNFDCIIRNAEFEDEIECLVEETVKSARECARIYNSMFGTDYPEESISFEIGDYESGYAPVFTYHPDENKIKLTFKYDSIGFSGEGAKFDLIYNFIDTRPETIAHEMAHWYHDMFMEYENAESKFPYDDNDFRPFSLPDTVGKTMEEKLLVMEKASDELQKSMKAGRKILDWYHGRIIIGEGVAKYISSLIYPNASMADNADYEKAFERLVIEKKNNFEDRHWYYIAGEKLVRPILDLDFRKGLRYLSRNTPSLESVEDLERYQKRGIRRVKLTR